MKRPVAPTFLVVDKPVGVTSHDIVSIVRALLGARRVGHTGTLDPFATGVLALATGPATRLISFLDESHKVYEAELYLGSATDTADTEGEVTATAPVPSLTVHDLQQVLDRFVGPRMQTPPMYSAIKINGRPLYSYARAGEAVDVPARPITIHQMDALSVDGASVRFRVACGRGTYVRTLGEEVAHALGTVGHLRQLRRLRSGPFVLEQAVQIGDLARLATGADRPVEDWRPVLRPARGAPRVVWQPREDCRRGLLAHALAPEVGFEALAVQHISLAESVRLLASGTCPPPHDSTPVGARYVVRDEIGMLALAECQSGEAGTETRAKALRVLARPSESASGAANGAE